MQSGYSMSRREWSDTTRPPVQIAPRTKPNGKGAMPRAFYFFDAEKQRWECEAGVTRSHARAALQARLKRKLLPGASLGSKKQRSERRASKKTAAASP